MPVYENKVTALIGPTGCGKSTFLRCFNRMHDLYPGNRYEGEIQLHPGQRRTARTRRSTRSRCACASGWCSRSPTRFPSRSSRTWPTACACAARSTRSVLDDKVEEALKGAALWDEVKDRLDELAVNLSGGQQQRLCIARALATDPEILLFDEPTSALDPIATGSIEELIGEIKQKVTILIVTHNMQQAARVSDYTAYMYLGELIEFGETRRDLHEAEEQADRGLHHRERAFGVTTEARAMTRHKHLSTQFDAELERRLDARAGDGRPGRVAGRRRPSTR